MQTQPHTRPSGLLQFLVGLIVVAFVGFAGFRGWQLYGPALLAPAQTTIGPLNPPAPRAPIAPRPFQAQPAQAAPAAQPAQLAPAEAPPTAAPVFQPEAPAGVNPATGGVMRVQPQQAEPVNPATQGPYRVGATVVVTGAPHTGESGRITFIDRSTGYITVTFADGSIGGYAESELQVQ